MPAQVLVLGGSRYFGRRLVELLLERGHSVTLGNRGTTADPFGDRVTRKVFDRTVPGALAKLAAIGHWDLVFDQICYSPGEALAACHAFDGRVGRYVHTSTGSVYLAPGNQTEAEFDPFHYEIRSGTREDLGYADAKRLAEAVFFQKAKFPVVAMRIPIVLGPDDYTGRLEFHVNHVRDGTPIVISNLNAETSFISSAEAARFLIWLSQSSVTGPLNGCSLGRISIGEILKLIEEKLGKKARVATAGAEKDFTPFVDENSRYLDPSRAGKLGFVFESLSSWFPSLVAQTCERLTK